LLASSLHVSSQNFALGVALPRSSPGVAAHNLISRKIASQAHKSTSILTTSCFVRLLLSCVIVGLWPLMATLLSFFFPCWSGGVPPWPGWAAVHRYFHEVPAIPLRFLTTYERHALLRGFWHEIISGFVIFGMFVFTEDVRNDLRLSWELLTHKIPRLRRCSAVPPSSPSREASSRGSHAIMLSTLVIDISAVKTESGESSSPCEPMPNTSYTA
jgi:hypothetical protein